MSAVFADRLSDMRAKSLTLTLPLELEDKGPLLRQRVFLWSGSLLIALVIAWAAVTPVREVAIAPGELAPSGLGRAIQHLEGGVVERILVKEGQLVEQGQPVLQLSPAISQADFAALASRQGALQQQKLQIEQLISQQPLGGIAPILAAEQARVLAGRLSARAQDEKTLRARLEQKRADLQSLEQEALHLRRIMEIQTEQLRMREQLAESGYTSRKLLLDSEGQLEQARQSVSTNLGRREAARNAVAEAESQLAAAEKEANRIWAEELAKVSAELDEVTQTLVKHKDRVERLIVRAPVSGMIQQVVPKVPGEVVRAGDPIAHFVPTSGVLVAELKVRPNDIPHVAVDRPAEIAINGADPRRDGKLKGRISFLSATTYPRENGETYYRALVSLEPTQRQLVAGMTVRGEIVTGSKSLLNYILRPIYDGIDLAFKER